MNTRTLPSSREARDAVAEALRLIPGPDIFVGNVPGDEGPGEHVKYDDDGRVHGYAVVWAGPGTYLQQRLCLTPDARQFPFQVTAAGGDDTRALWVADLVTAGLVGLRLTLADGSISTPIRMPVDGDIGPVRIDREVTPTRHYVPLLFTCRLA